MQHRIYAVLQEGKSLPPVPDTLQDQLAVFEQGNQKVMIETPGELSTILQWLANSPLQDVHVQPVGLRSVYDRFHREEHSQPELARV